MPTPCRLCASKLHAWPLSARWMVGRGLWWALRTALPLVALARSRRVGDAAFDEIFHPIAERLLERCDAVLRVRGVSAGADEVVRIGRSRGHRIFDRIEQVPGCER